MAAKGYDPDEADVTVPDPADKGCARRTAVTSDPHLPRTPAEVIAGVIADIAAFAPDALVLAGDLGESSAPARAGGPVSCGGPLIAPRSTCPAASWNLEEP
jgi:hypothetical protein